MRLNYTYLARVPVDWAWVKKRLFEIEKIPPASSPEANTLILDAVDKCLKLASPMAEGKAAWAENEISSLKGGSVSTKGGISLSSRRLAAFIKGADLSAVFLVTIGDRIEKTATMWMDKGEPLYGYLLDRIGSLAAESLAEHFEEKIRKMHESRGKSVSMRFSPGYCDWPIEDQRKLAKILDFSKAGVRMTKTCVLLPKKSISAIVGIAPEGVFSKTGSQCTACSKKDCSYRRATSLY